MRRGYRQQTNLLAENAAIEVALPVSTGCGFAVAELQRGAQRMRELADVA